MMGVLSTVSLYTASLCVLLQSTECITLYPPVHRLHHCVLLQSPDCITQCPPAVPGLHHSVSWSSPWTASLLPQPGDVRGLKGRWVSKESRREWERSAQSRRAEAGCYTIKRRGWCRCSVTVDCHQARLTLLLAGPGGEIVTFWPTGWTTGQLVAH